MVPVAQTAVLKLDLENILETGMAQPLTSQKVMWGEGGIKN